MNIINFVLLTLISYFSDFYIKEKFVSGNEETKLNKNINATITELNSLNSFLNSAQNISGTYVIEPIYYDYDNGKYNSQEEEEEAEDEEGGDEDNRADEENFHKNYPTTVQASTTSSLLQTTDVIKLKSANLITSSAPDIYPDPDYLLKLKIQSKTNNKFIIENEILKKKNFYDVKENDGNELFNENYDKDLKGHDLIDNIMYIYYGSNAVVMRKGLGDNIIVIGAVFGLAAQILTIALSYLRNRRLRRINNALFPITINLLLMLCTSNFIFIIGVQSSRNPIKCEIIAILLHYLHLSTSVWGLIYVITIYQFISNEFITNLKNNYLIAYLGSGAYVMISYAFSNENYETRRYCWMSVQRGMIVNFMIPSSILIIISTILGTMCLRKIINKQREIIAESIESIIESVATKFEIQTSKINTPSHHSIINHNSHCTAQEQNNDNIITNFNDDDVADPLNKQQTNGCDDKFENECPNNSHINCNQNYNQQSTNTLNETNCEYYNQNEVDNDLLRSKMDLYDSKFNLAALSLADLSLQSTSDIQDYADFKKAIRFSLFFEPTFSVCWFLGVIALENSQLSCIMPVIYFIIYNLMNWILLTKISIIYPMINLTTKASSSQSSTLSINQSINNNMKSNNFCQSSSSLNHHSNNKTNMLLLNETTSAATSLININNLNNNKKSVNNCTDTIPLLCSTSSGLNNIVNLNKNAEFNQHYNWETVNLDNNKISSTNFDCISTISS